MKYEVGDIVKIKSLDWYNENKGVNNGTIIYPTEKENCYNIMTKSMSIYCGKTAKIVEIVNNDYYYLDIDNKSRTWSGWMFEERLEDIFKTSIKNLCNNFCYMECNKDCPLFKFKELL